MLISKPFLAPVSVCNPYDPAIDTAAWGHNPDTYLHEIVTSDHDVPLPPVKPGEKLTVIQIAPLEYAAHVRLEHMVQAASEAGYWALDPEIQAHVLRHGIVGIDNAATEREDGSHAPIYARREEGPLGRRLTAESWRDIAPFADTHVWAMLTMACAVLSRRHAAGIAR